jgi:hypothetical protein
MRVAWLIFLLALPALSHAQHVSAYSDNRKYFYAFDNGTYQQLEYLPVKSYRISGNCIAYVDNTNEFKIYSGGQVYKQNIYAADFVYGATYNLVPFRLGKALYAFDNGQRHALTYYTQAFAAGDSVVAFTEETSGGLKIYYKGNITEAENTLFQDAAQVVAGGNIVAFADPAGYFRIFYSGTTVTCSEAPPVSVKAGSDIAAWVDGYSQAFMAFYRGDTAQLDAFMPQSYQVGFGLLAFVNSLGEFRIVSGGGMRTVSSFAPDWYKVEGNTVIYAQNNRLMAIYNGRETELENYVPADVQVSLNGAAYKDVSGRLKCFWKGTLSTVTYDIVSNFTLYGDVLTYETGPSHTEFFFNGRNY